MYRFLKELQGLVYHTLNLTSLYTAVTIFVGAAIINFVVGDNND